MKTVLIIYLVSAYIMLLVAPRLNKLWLIKTFIPVVNTINAAQFLTGYVITLIINIFHKR